MLRVLFIVCLGLVSRACVALSRIAKPSGKDIATNLQNSILVVISGNREHFVAILRHIVATATHPDRVFVSVSLSQVPQMPPCLSRHIRTASGQEALEDGYAFCLVVRNTTRLVNGWDTICVSQLRASALLRNPVVLTSLPRIEPSHTFTCLTRKQRRVGSRYLARDVKDRSAVPNVFASHSFLFFETALGLGALLASADGSDVLLSCTLHARSVRFLIPACIIWCTNERILPDRTALASSTHDDVFGFFGVTAHDPMPSRFVVGLTSGADSNELIMKYGSVSAAHAKTRRAGCVQVEDIDGDIV